MSITSVFCAYIVRDAVRRALDAILEKVAQNVQGLDELQSRVDGQRVACGDQRDSVARERSDALNSE